MWLRGAVLLLTLVAAANAFNSCFPNGTFIVDGTCPGNAFRKVAPRLYEDQIMEFVNVTLRQFLQSIDGSGVLPPLDPLEINREISLTLGSGESAMKITLQNLVIADLLDYLAINGTYSIVGFKFPVSIMFPNVTISGEYSIDGWLGGDLLYITGSGPFSLSIIDLLIMLDLDLATDENDILLLECLGLHYEVADIECDFEGLFGGGSLGDTANAVLEDAAPTLVNLAEPMLEELIACPLRDVANNQLSLRGVTLASLLCLVVGIGC